MNGRERLKSTLKSRRFSGILSVLVAGFAGGVIAIGGAYLGVALFVAALALVVYAVGE